MLYILVFATFQPFLVRSAFPRCLQERSNPKHPLPTLSSFTATAAAAYLQSPGSDWVSSQLSTCVHHTLGPTRPVWPAGLGSGILWQQQRRQRVILIQQKNMKSLRFPHAFRIKPNVNSEQRIFGREAAFSFFTLFMLSRTNASTQRSKESAFK